MRFLAFIASLLVTAQGWSAEVIPNIRPDTTLVSTRHTNGLPRAPLAPGPNDSKIARVTALYLERFHYLHQEFDDAVSSKFFDKYLDALDPAHLILLQSDVAEFEKWRTHLDLVLKRLWGFAKVRSRRLGKNANGPSGRWRW